MNFQRFDLLLFWLGGGVVLLLAWAAVMGQALVADHRAKVPAAIGLLAGLGLFHPAAAVGAVDLIRLCRTLDEPQLQLPDWAMPTAVAVGALGVVLAMVLWSGAT